MLLLTTDMVSVAVNIIGVPSEGLAGWLTNGLVPGKNAQAGSAPKDVIAYLPPPLLEFFTSIPPAGTYANKKILSLHAENDKMLPASFGAAYFPGIQAQAQTGDIVQWIQPDTEHACTPEMTRCAAEWFWRWSLSGLPSARL